MRLKACPPLVAMYTHDRDLTANAAMHLDLHGLVFVLTVPARPPENAFSLKKS